MGRSPERAAAAEKDESIEGMSVVGARVGGVDVVVVAAVVVVVVVDVGEEEPTEG